MRRTQLTQPKAQSSTRAAMRKIQEILNHEPCDPWIELCVAAARLGAALAEFDNARKAYVKWKKEQE